MSDLKSYCALHAKPKRPYHTVERWWMLDTMGSKCCQCGRTALWSCLTYGEKAKDDRAHAA